MDKVFKIMEEMYDIYQNAKKNTSINPPSWKESYGNYYKYYFNNIVKVDLDVENNKLLIRHKDLGVKEEYILTYPRFTVKGTDEDPNFFNMYFAVRHNNKSGVLVIKAVNIVNLKELLHSKFRVDMTDKEDYLSEEEILKYQEYTYRKLGIGIGVRELSVMDEDLENMNITRGEYLYTINRIKLNGEENYLKNRFLELGIDLDLDIDNINESNYEVIGLEEIDYNSIVLTRELRQQCESRRERLEKGRSKYQISLDEIINNITKSILLEEENCFIVNRNIPQTLKEYGYKIENINIVELTNKLIQRISKTKLSIMEMVQIVFNYKRSLSEAFYIEEMRKTIEVNNEH